MNFVKGELVTRISYEHDLLFKIKAIKDDQAILHGIDIRLEADAPVDDLVRVKDKDLEIRNKTRKEQEEFSYRLFKQDYQMLREKRDFESTDEYQQDANYFRLPIKVLHLDGDQSYLKKCIELYLKLGLQVHGVYLTEKEMPLEIGDLVKRIQPNIVVITGHDAYSKNKGLKKDIRAYRNSSYFSETVRKVREIIPGPDQLVVFAGACQSHFESLIRAGANFASSPERINIHALDPVYIVARVAYTSFMEKVSLWDVLRNTLTGQKGMGGIETRGLHRIGMPYISPEENSESHL
jgi:spore coat assembly protein